MAESGYIAFFFVLMALVSFMGYLGQDLAQNEDLEALPQLDEDPGLFATIGYGFEFIGYMLGFRGFTVVGFPTIVNNLIAVVLYGILMYVVIRLVRGGG